MKVKFGPSCVSSIERAQFALDQKIGNSFGLLLSDDFDEALRLAAFCREHKLPFLVMGLARRERYRLNLSVEELFQGRLTSDQFRQLIEAGGGYYLGRYVVGESTGMLYQPEEYLVNSAEPDKPHSGEYPLLAAADSLPEARDNFLFQLQNFIAQEKQYGGEPFWNTDSSMLFWETMTQGIDVPFLEMFPGNPEWMTAALRGAARALGRKEFGALVAYGWYGGGDWDELYLKRWQNSLYYCYLAGLTTIHSESGHFGCSALGKNIQRDDPLAARFRQIMRNFTEFCEKDDRPEEGPDVKIGILYGKLDGYPGLWSNCVWGQFQQPDFRCGDAERSWNLLNALMRKCPWYDNLNIGDNDFSGQPACGMYDIVPAEAPQEALERYSCLIFLGWNTMTAELYARLKAYVENGGTLIAALPHLCTNIQRNTPWEPFENGDWRDLFGVLVNGEEEEPVKGIKLCNIPGGRYVLPDWSKDCDPKFMGKGFAAGKLIQSTAKVRAFSSNYFFPEAADEKHIPVLLENACGKGRTFLVNAWAFPGNENLFDFYRVLLRAVMIGEQPETLKVICHDNIRYGLYGKSLYLLNTDCDLPSVCKVIYQDHSKEVTLAPGEFRRIDGE